MAIYCNFEGIKGAVTAAKYEKWVELLSVNFGVARPVTNVTGRMGNRSVENPNFSDVSCVKISDESTINFIQEAFAGKGKKVEIVFTETGQTGEISEYMKVTMKDVIISSHSLSGSEGGQATESMTLNASHMEFAYTSSDSKGATGTPTRAAWDIAKGCKG